VGIELWVLAIIIIAAMWIGYGIAAMGRKREHEEQMQTAGAEPEQGSFKVRIKQNSQTLAEQIQRLTAARSIHTFQTAEHHVPHPKGAEQHAPQSEAAMQHAQQSEGAAQHFTHPEGTEQHTPHPEGAAQYIAQPQVTAPHTPQPQITAPHAAQPQTGYNASANWRPAPEASAEPDHKVGKLLETATRRFTRDTHRKKGETVHTGFCIGSPAQGECRSVQDDYQQGFRIYPRQGSVYAPASGKITRLYPTGNAFRLRTDEGVDLTLRVGTNTEELEGMYFRPRVVQNEVVGKGKLLLEYDLESIRREGYDTTLWMTVEDHEDYQSIEFTMDGIAKIGESLMWISK
jgi:phosphotransferase system IIA component